MYPHVVDGADWLDRRRQTLRDGLKGELSDDERKAHEDELAVLSEEGGVGCFGPSSGRRWKPRRRRPAGTNDDSQ